MAVGNARGRSQILWVICAGIAAASAKVDAMLGSRTQLLKPQQLEPTAAIQQPLSAPVACPTRQPGMEATRSTPPLSGFASVPAEAMGAGLFRAAQMPMHPAANPMALHLYQALMAASMMGAGGQHPMQEGALLMPAPDTPACHHSLSVQYACAQYAGVQYKVLQDQ